MPVAIDDALWVDSHAALGLVVQCLENQHGISGDADAVLLLHLTDLLHQLRGAFVFVELHVDFIGRPVAHESVGLKVAGGKEHGKTEEEKRRFFHGFDFVAKVGFFIFVGAKTNDFMDSPQLQWFKTEEREGRTMVFDPLRRRFVALTPEEEVRQKVLYLLVERFHVPAGLLAVEYSVKVNGLDKRCDAVVFGKEGQPLMIVECKAPSVKITDKVLDQAVRYHSALQPKYLLLFNGETCFCFKVEVGDLHALDHLPDYNEMVE